MPPRRKPGPKPTRAKRRSPKIKQRCQPRAHLLIIECDSRKLATDGLDLGSAFGKIISTLFPEKRIAIVHTTSEEKLKEDLADVFKEHGRVRSILIVGHSNEVGLVLTADGLRGWGVVGNWLYRFEPEFCFLAACQAGKSEAIRNLFEPIKTLRQIYASPTALYKNQEFPACRPHCDVAEDRQDCRRPVWCPAAGQLRSNGGANLPMEARRGRTRRGDKSPLAGRCCHLV